MRWLAIAFLGWISVSPSAQTEAPFDPTAQSEVTGTLRRLDWSAFEEIGTTTGPFRTRSRQPTTTSGRVHLPPELQVRAIEPIFRPREAAPVWMEALADLHTPSMPTVARESLEDLGEAFQPFAEVPGGIVLGRAANAPAELKGAQLEFVKRESTFELSLWSSKGLRYTLPTVQNSILADAAAFVANPRGSDSLIDLYGDAVAWRAPEIQDAHLIQMLRRVDRTPRRTLPGSHPHKAVIVDRDVHIVMEPGQGRARLKANLDVRLYAASSSGYVLNAARRVAAYGFEDTLTGMKPMGPMPEGALTANLCTALDELAPLARWIGFLRWVRSTDPARFEELRSALGSADSASGRD